VAAPPLNNTFEGGTDTTTITTGNSGGASGDAFSTVVIGASATVTFSATHAHRGTLGMALTQPVTGVQTYVDWISLGSITGNFYARFYLWLTSLPTLTPYLLHVRTSGDVSCAYPIRINTTGFIQAGDATPSGIAASLGTVACATGKWIRIEARVLPSATVGEIEWRLFNTADSTTADDTKNATGLVLGGANIDRVRIGNPNNFESSRTFYFDDLAVSTAGWIGPSILPAATNAFA
jgi:hypothetical protein